MAGGRPVSAVTRVGYSRISFRREILQFTKMSCGAGLQPDNVGGDGNLSRFPHILTPVWIAVTGGSSHNRRNIRGLKPGPT